MLNGRLPLSESAQSLLLLPKPFLSCHGSATQLTIRPRHAHPFHKQKNYSIRSHLPACNNKQVPTPVINELPLCRKSFPQDFFFGTASSAYQYEGAYSDGKGESNWDHFTHTHPDKIKDRSNGDVAVDSYHRYKEDVALMKDIGLTAYRFSIAWTRILPTGKLSGGVNKEGVQYYNNLIDELLSQGIQPFVTLFHWDVPQALEEEYGGFLSRDIINDFRDYAEVCYKEFGDRVKFWMTLNEPWTFTVGGYVQGTFPPGKTENAGTDPYLVAHNLLLSHASAVDTYRKKYKATQNGQIGITLNYFWMIFYSNSPADIAACQRASDFMFGWFMEPVTTGEYPKSMQKLVGPRLPRFYEEEYEMLKGSYDFLGLNYYTANYAKDALLSGGVPTPFASPSYTTDSHCIQTLERNGIPIGTPTASDWLYIYPEGLESMLIDIKIKYNNPVIYVAENGISDDAKLPKAESLQDDLRKEALSDHLQYLRNAMDLGVNVKGFFLWSLLDNFEWDCGYTVRFGINYVDFNDDLKREPKLSANWFKNFLKED
ncbi:beta-glucosidase 24-like [Macadamia integrifolia]|uniref:beta-glucosidase 24-like n=1 Tax=Macadamia integrifolia TaxID=60698 RepID=UPI001C4EAB06|nr:beta-glucosidase 24-like [Macadamia integrifolia]